MDQLALEPELHDDSGSEGDNVSLGTDSNGADAASVSSRDTDPGGTIGGADTSGVDTDFDTDADTASVSTDYSADSVQLSITDAAADDTTAAAAAPLRCADASFRRRL